MPDPVAVTGRVQLASGAPAAGAIVECRPVPASVSLRGSAAISADPETFTADASGVFTGQLVAGIYHLRVRAAGRWWSTVTVAVPGAVFAAPAALVPDDFTAEWRSRAGVPEAAVLTFTRRSAAIVAGVIVLPHPVSVVVPDGGAVEATLIAGDYDVIAKANGVTDPTFTTSAPGDWLTGGEPVDPGDALLFNGTPLTFDGDPLTFIAA